MVSAYIVFGLGIAVSTMNIILWCFIIRSQIEQFLPNKKKNDYIKKVLLLFGVISLLANIIPIWFDIYRLIYIVEPSNIFYTYVINSFLYRTTTTIMFYLIYRF